VSVLSPAIAIRPFDASAAPRWDAYLRQASGGTICHLTGWSSVIERVWSHQPYSIYAEQAGAVVGILPLFQLQSRIFGSMLVSTPAAIYGGVVADHLAARRALLAEAQRLAERLAVDYLELRNSQPDGASEAAGFLQKDLYVTFERPLPADETTLLASLPKKIRYAIRQARRSGLSSQLGREALLDQFYDVFAANMRNLGTPVYPKRFFAELLRAFPDHTDIMLVRLNGRVAGATMNFYFDGTVLPYYGCAYAALHHTGLTAFMYFELMRRAAERGYTHFDFGRSKRGSGSWAYKRGWKMTERPLPYQFYLVRATRLPGLDPTNPRFKPLIELWKRLPLRLTKLLGPPLIRNIP
jgi:FemAB-related protein (PEP-CTERM system-associated)